MFPSFPFFLPFHKVSLFVHRIFHQRTLSWFPPPPPTHFSPMSPSTLFPSGKHCILSPPPRDNKIFSPPQNEFFPSLCLRLLRPFFFFNFSFFIRYGSLSASPISRPYRDIIQTPYCFPTLPSNPILQKKVLKTLPPPPSFFPPPLASDFLGVRRSFFCDPH